MKIWMAVYTKPRNEKMTYKYLCEKKIKTYLGTSSTKSVMNLSKKLNRKSFLSVYYIDI